MSEITSSDLMNFASSMKENEGIFGGNGLWFLLILFFLFSGNGFGGNSQAVTRAEMQDAFNNQNVVNSLNTMSTAMNSGFDNVQLGLNSGFNSVQSAIADARYAMSDCCCQIKNAIATDGAQTRQLIQENTIQNLRDELSDSKMNGYVTGLTAAQTIQTNNLENFMRSLFGGCSCSA